MGFNFYFTGVPSQGEAADFLIEKQACILLSQLNERNNICRWVDRIKELSNRPNLFIDSGAFSAWTKGKVIDVEEYIDFINDNSDYFTVCASVDHIPGTPRASEVATTEEIEFSAQKTWDNYLYMRSKLKDPSKLLCTFHCGEGWENLERMLNYKDERGSIEYIGFGALVGKSEAVIKSFLDKAFSLIKKSSNPNIKVHAFGMTRLKYLEEYPFYSADSTSWLQTAAYGSIILDTKVIYASDRNAEGFANIISNNSLKGMIEARCEKYGLTFDDVINNGTIRTLFNLKSCQDWADNYILKQSNLFKKTLF